MFSLAKESVSIYLDEHSLKMVKVQETGNGRELSHVYFKDLKGATAETAVRSLWEGKKLIGMHGRKAHVVISSNRLITKSIEVPSLDDNEIGDIIRLQAGRHTPYNRDEIVVGFINLEVVLDRYMKSLLTIVSNDTIRMVTTTLDLAGFQIESVHLSSEVVAQGIVVAEKLTEEDKATAVLHVDQAFTDFIVIRKQKPFFIRNIPIGFSQLTTSTKAMRGEVKKSLEAYLNDELGESPERYLIVGSDVDRLEEMRSALAEETKVKVELYPLQKKLLTSAVAEAELSNLKDNSLLDPILNGFYGDDAEVQLIPEDLKIKRNFRQRGQDIFIGGICLMIIFILSMGGYLTKIYFRSYYLTTLQEQFQAKSRDVDELIFLSDQTRQVNQFRTKKGRSVTVLNELATILPAEMYLKEISYNDDEGKIALSGTSELMSLVFSFVTEFENHPMFQNVTTDFTKSRKEGTQDVADFGITAFIEDTYNPNG